MNDSDIEKPARYCYHCGNRLTENAEHCWYCGMPVHRQIRELRRCTFCSTPIRQEAIKCRHCGEFLDGRPSSDQKIVNRVLVIDHNMIKTISDMHLFPGFPVPDEAKKVLNERTIRAIEKNRLDRINQPGVLALPAPSAAPIRIDLKHDGKGEPDQSKEVSPVEATASEPSEVMPDEVVDVEAPNAYRNCTTCNTEILAIDNYCFYCGTQYHRTTADEHREAQRRRRRRKARIRKIIYYVILIIIVLLIIYFFFRGSLTLKNIDATSRKTQGAVKEILVKGESSVSRVTRSKAIANAEGCRDNITRIESAKRAASSKFGINAGTLPLEYILQELKSSQLPVCPSGGNYTVNPVGMMPTCSISNNKTQTQDDDHIIINW